MRGRPNASQRILPSQGAIFGSHRLTFSAIVDTREDAYRIVAHGSSIKIHWTISV